MEKLCVYSSQALNLFDFINIDYNEPILEYCVGPCAINRNKLLDINGGFLEDIEFAKQNVIVIFDGKSRFKEVVFNCRNIGKKIKVAQRILFMNLMINSHSQNSY
jgi:hypothetical protein